MSAGGTVLVAGGGTGGHVFPALATAAALAGLAPDLAVEFVGTAGGLESRLVPEAGWTLHALPAMALSRTRPWTAVRLPLVLAQGVARARALIRARGARAALCFGGYTSVPLAVAAGLCRIPLLLHEQNAVPGVANRLAARWAAAVAVAIAPAGTAFGGRRVVVTGNPVRPDFAARADAASHEAAVEHFGLDPARRTLLAFGGSQGAGSLNRALVGSAGLWAAPDGLQVLHATGAATHAETAAAWGRAPLGGLRVVHREFVARMDLAYAAADVVLCRAGASTLAELALVGLPAVLVPYPHATGDHQTGNARTVAVAGAGVLLPDAELTPRRLVAAAEPLLTDVAARTRMAAAARGLARPDAAEDVARLVLAELGR